MSLPPPPTLVYFRRVLGTKAAVLLAGWRITGASARAWAEALDGARLGALGVSTVYAVEGPAQVDFRAKELAVDALLADLERAPGTPPRSALVVAHSSGAHVAATLFARAFRGGRASPLRGRVVYVDLDGDRGIAGDPERRLTDESVLSVCVTPASRAASATESSPNGCARRMKAVGAITIGSACRRPSNSTLVSGSPTPRSTR
jgi:hypothetical protein